MGNILLLIAEFAGFYFLSRILLQRMYDVFLLISRSPSVTLSVVTAILFPGTVIHELSHLFVAEILGVRAGSLSLTPEVPSRGSIDKTVRAGSVAIAETGPFRRAVIGVAPIIVGLIVLTALSLQMTAQASRVASSGFHTLFSNTSFYLLILIFYVIFAVSNTMFSSKEDMKGFIPIVVSIALLIGLLYLTGIRITLTGQAFLLFQRIIQSLSRSLGVVLAVNGILLLITSVLIAVIEKITHKRLVSSP